MWRGLDCGARCPWFRRQLSFRGRFRLCGRQRFCWQRSLHALLRSGGLWRLVGKLRFTRRLRLARGVRRCLWRCIVSLIPQKLLVVLAGDGGAHEVHPDGQGGAGAGFLFAQRLAAVVAHPDAAGNRGREAQEPGVGEVAGGAGLAAKRVVQLRGGGAGAVLR